MSLPPIPIAQRVSDPASGLMVQEWADWLRLLAGNAGALEVTEQTITVTREIIATSFSGTIAGAQVASPISWPALPSGAGVWSGAPSITGAIVAQSDLSVGGITTLSGNLVPAVTGAVDLGRPDKRFRAAYIGTIDATLFAKSTQTLYGGWLAVSKNAGTFASAVVPLSTTVDFGQVMTPGQFVLVRAVDATGAVAEEYFQVGAVVAGTVYNVTRNLSGAGLRDWRAGTPYQVRGVSGDGWVELNAFNTPRMSIFTQGGAWNTVTENLRIGYLSGMPNSASGLGIYAGNASNYFLWDGTNFILKAAKIQIDGGGITAGIGGPSSFDSTGAYRFARNTILNFGQTGDVFGSYSTQSGSHHFITLENTMVGIGALSGGSPGDARIFITATGWNPGGATGTAARYASIIVRSDFPGITDVSTITLDALQTFFTGSLRQQTSGSFEYGELKQLNAHQFGFSQNLSYTGTYNLGDTAFPGWLMRLGTDTDALEVLRASAGANPRTPASLLSLSSAGALSVAGTINNVTLNAVVFGTFNDALVHASGQFIGSQAGYIKIASTAGVTMLPYFSNGGAGLGWAWTILSPGGAWNYVSGGGPNTVSFTDGSGTNTYTVSFSGGTGSVSVQRTAGAAAYTVTIFSLV